MIRDIRTVEEGVELRPMLEQPPDAPAFGVPFLLTALFRRPANG